MAKSVAVGTMESCSNLFQSMPWFRPDKPWPELNQNLSGKVCLITGANTGIGFATAQLLAERGAHVLIACRSKERALEAAKALRDVPHLPGCPAPRIEYESLDLADLKSVRSFCSRFSRRSLPLHLLVCNAGIMAPPQRQTTVDGLELQFQVNFLGHWLLAQQLIADQRNRRKKTRPLSTKTTQQPPAAPSADALYPCQLLDGTTRLVMVSSLTHRAGVLQWHDMQAERGYSPYRSYGLTKLADILTAKEFQQRFDRHPEYGADVAVALHPGIVRTKLATGFYKQTVRGVLAAKQLADEVVERLLTSMMKDVRTSARFLLRAALLPAHQVAGQYMVEGRPARPDKTAEDPHLSLQLWRYAEQLTGEHTPACLS